VCAYASHEQHHIQKLGEREKKRATGEMVINKRVARKMKKRKCDRQLEAEVSIFSLSLAFFSPASQIVLASIRFLVVSSPPNSFLIVFYQLFHYSN
jgi:hypothetical protein